MRRLDNSFLPTLVKIELPNHGLIEAAEKELRARADLDENKCWGYFPDLPGNEFGLPESEAFARAVSTITIAGKMLDFSFIRLSLIRQKHQAQYHLDADAKTALKGSADTINQRLVWRLLLNLSDTHARTLGYLHVDSSDMKLEVKNGYIHCSDNDITDTMRQEIHIPPRAKNLVSGVLFCASRVLHTGKDDEHGHFVAGYGYEVNKE